ncbi:type IV pilus twitching motility protein PilT [Tissierella pigra]|uniref:Type IV pilus twitching motility protein PilT n=1 Tax=Tissierella pigra TaxID=2607614 RepID=A0A6N7XCW9_9FIRM|nr:type IV pilus twitching motility protein PilT [Tissierella pigra]MBU5426691.1 type IV pilus twitching motility protein PilT [Tissierella pigra]MST99868.1 type IV pilus twitching motility protein PilT [Tissierella pigra]
MNVVELVNIATEKKASDIHITVGTPPVLRINGELLVLEGEKLMPQDTKALVYETLDERTIEELEENGEVDTSFSSPGVGRYRVNAYKQRGSYGMALRIIPLEVPTIDELGLPGVVKDLARLPRGLILVTGPTGSGKSTTLASMIDLINKEKKCHILTLEDPIEYLHKHNKSIVNQREIGIDSNSFANSLRAALRQDPDVILVGEMRDLETISIAITAAETGHLVLSTLHTIGSAKTIDRIIDVFPPHQQQQVRVQFASVVQAIISQQLLPKADGSGRTAAFEVMVATSAIRNLIREEKIHQIDTAIQTGAKFQMQTMDNSLLDLYKKGLITKEIALMQAINQDNIKKYII